MKCPGLVSSVDIEILLTRFDVGSVPLFDSSPQQNGFMKAKADLGFLSLNSSVANAFFAHQTMLQLFTGTKGLQILSKL